MGDDNNNKEIIEKGTIMTTGQNHGLLQPEEAQKFLVDVFGDSSFLGRMSWEVKGTTSGSVDTLGIGERLLRGAIEDNDNVSGKEIEPKFDNIKYQTNHMVLGFSITEKFLRENKEKENFEELFMGLVAKQVKLDILDGAFNWDTATLSTNPDYEFLKLDDGIIKQVKNKGHILDASQYNGYSDDMFIDALEILPVKYFDPSKYVWIANHRERLKFNKHLKKRNTTAGDLALLSGNKLNPQELEWATIPKFPDGKILLADPAMLKLIFTYDMYLRATREGREAVYSDKRFYAMHMDIDTLIMRPDAMVLIDNISKKI